MVGNNSAEEEDHLMEEELNISEDFSYPSLAKTLTLFKDASAVQEALHKLDTEQLSQLATIMYTVKPAYEEEKRKIDLQDVFTKPKKTNINCKFLKVVAEINKTVVWFESMAESGILYERIECIFLNFKDLQLFLKNINSETPNFDGNHHSDYLKLITSFERNHNALVLFSTYIRGKFYLTYKNKFQMTNKQLADKFLLNITHIERMIKCFALIKKFPLLLKTKICSSSRPMSEYTSKIDSYISSNSEINIIYTKKITKIVMLFKGIDKTNNNLTYEIPFM